MSIPADVKTLMDDLSTNPKYIGECPNCSESFKLKDAGLFYFDNLTPKAEMSKQGLEDEIGQIEKSYKELLVKIKKGAPKISLAVIVGKTVEKIAPSLSGFPYNIGDCRFLGEPIDYVVFNGIALKGKIDELTFVDIKTGDARLKKGQRFIKDAVEHKRVDFMLYEGR